MGVRAGEFFTGEGKGDAVTMKNSFTFIMWLILNKTGFMPLNTLYSKTMF